MKPQKGLFGDIKERISSLSAKKIAIIALVSALILAPTAFALSYVFYYEFFRTDELFYVTLYDKDGAAIASESGDPEDTEASTLTNIFYKLTSAPDKSDTQTAPSDGQIYVKAVTDYKGTRSELDCYFSADTSDSFYVSEGTRYRISESLNAEFMSTPYSECFYDTAKCPSLITIDLDTILPSKVDWHYKNKSGEYILANQNQCTDKERSYEITGSIDMSFSVPPDSTHVRVYSDEKLLHRGTIEDLPALTENAHGELRIYVESEWQRADDKESFGTLTYNFYVKTKNRPTFSVSSDTVVSGGFVILDCANVTDISKIDFQSSRDGYKPIFREYNGITRTIIPFSESENEETFSFTVSYGAASQSFDVTVLPKDTDEVFSYSSLVFENENIPTLEAQSIKKAILSTQIPQDELVYFQGNFSDPTELGYVIAYTHGSTVRWGSSLEYSYTALGNGYVTRTDTVGGSSVRVLQNGVVAQIGSNTLLGNYAVVEHGCGLRTWYTGLECVDASVGDILLSGQHIGKASVGSIDGKEGFTLYCTIYDTMIDPCVLFNSSVMPAGFSSLFFCIPTVRQRYFSHFSK